MMIVIGIPVAEAAALGAPPRVKGSKMCGKKGSSKPPMVGLLYPPCSPGKIGFIVKGYSCGWTVAPVCCAAVECIERKSGIVGLFVIPPTEFGTTAAWKMVKGEFAELGDRSPAPPPCCCCWFAALAGGVGKMGNWNPVDTDG